MKQRREPMLLRPTGTAVSAAKVGTSKVVKSTEIKCLIRTQPIVESLFDARIAEWAKREGDTFEVGDKIATIDTQYMRVILIATRPGRLDKRFRSILSGSDGMEEEGWISEDGAYCAGGTFRTGDRPESAMTAPIDRTPQGRAFVEFRLVTDLIENAPRLTGYTLPTKCLLRLAALMMIDRIDGDVRDHFELLLPLLKGAYPTKRRRPLIDALFFDVSAILWFHDLEYHTWSPSNTEPLVRETVERDYLALVGSGADPSGAKRDIAAMQGVIDSLLPRQVASDTDWYDDD